MNERLTEIQKEVSLKGFRPGKVPPAVIKSQFGKSIYGEVIDKILRETTSKAINEKKLNVDVEIDGGINFENCSKAKDAGANILVSGSTIFKENKGDLKKNIEILRNN